MLNSNFMCRLLPLIYVLVVAGCAAPTKKADFADMNYFKIDCSMKSEQIRFLESQIPTQNERVLNALTITSISGVVLSMLDGTYEEKRRIHDRSYQAVIRHALWDLRTYCP